MVIVTIRHQGGFQSPIRYAQPRDRGNNNKQKDRIGEESYASSSSI
jgi:hypothetical protein